MSAGIFGEAVEHEIGAEAQRLLPQRPKESVVDHDRRLLAVEQPVARRGDRFDIDELVGRVGRAFEIDQSHPARALGLGQHRLDLGARCARREIEPVDAEAAEHLADQSLGRGIERCRMDDRVAGMDQSQQHRRDRGHAR